LTQDDFRIWAKERAGGGGFLKGEELAQSLCVALEQGREVGVAEQLQADTNLRTHYAKMLSIYDENDSPPCWEDILEAVAEKGLPRALPYTNPGKVVFPTFEAEGLPVNVNAVIEEGAKATFGTPDQEEP
jgi:hypothetical protein